MVIEKTMISRKRSLVHSTAAAAAAAATPTPKKKTLVKITSRLPHRLSVKKKDAPAETLKESLMNLLLSQGVNAKILRFDVVESNFEEPQQFEIEAYGFEALDAVRKRDMEKLKQFHTEGRPLKCSNRFGESILHLACRKGFTDVVDFLINTAQVPLWVKDDFGRNPLHDACWTVEPNFELMDILIDKAPDLLLISDARGHTPLSYVRREHWDTWINYLNGKASSLKPVTLQF
jgi:ankyrin repeat protein